MWNANLCDGGRSGTQGLLHSRGFHSSTGPNRPQCASMVLLRATMGHTHRVDAKVRKATADRSNRQGKLDVMAAGRWGIASSLSAPRNDKFDSKTARRANHFGFSELVSSP